MPRQNKALKTVVSAPVVDSTHVESELIVEPTSELSMMNQNMSEKKVKKVKATKQESTTTVEMTPAVVSDTESPVLPDDVEVPVAEQSVEFLAKLQQLGVLISSLKNEYRNLEKKWSRELKSAQKQSSKRKRKAGNRAPSGFVKPTRISDELAKFLDKPAGSEMARTEVTRDINKYIRINNLQDKENGRKINPDSKLAALLKLKKSDELTYFNLQRYMSPHFAKASKEVTTVQ
jgi:upstream activation factor subunit UAF30